ncbi:hypothetical protein GCM10027167_11660 [Nocardia heshunensis]
MVDEGTQKIDDHRMDKRLAPKWGTVMLTDITQPDIQGWVADLRKTMAPTSVGKCYRLLSSSLKSAHAAKLIPENPCHDIELPKPGPTPERDLEDDEVAACTRSVRRRRSNRAQRLAAGTHPHLCRSTRTSEGNPATGASTSRPRVTADDSAMRQAGRQPMG